MYSIPTFQLSYVQTGEIPQSAVSRVATLRDASDFLRVKLSNLPFEQTVVVALDAGHRVIGHTTSTLHEPSTSAVSIRSIALFILSSGASAFIFAHNHPGGAITASEHDKQITRKLAQLGELVNCPLLDHILVANNDTFSLRVLHPTLFRS